MSLLIPSVAADIADLITRPKGLDEIHDDALIGLYHKDQWCATPIASLAFSNVGGDKDFASVVFPSGFLPTGAVVDSIFLLVGWRKQADTSAGVNAVSAAGKRIRIMKNGGTWGSDDIIAITMANGGLSTEANTTEGGLWLCGDVDVKGEVDDVDNQTYLIRSEETNRADSIVVTAASLTLYDIYSILRVYYHI